MLNYDSFRTSKKEGRKAYQENGNLVSFSKYHANKADLLEGTDVTALIQVIRQLNPVVIVNGHDIIGQVQRRQILKTS